MQGYMYIFQDAGSLHSFNMEQSANADTDIQINFPLSTTLFLSQSFHLKHRSSTCLCVRVGYQSLHSSLCLDSIQYFS